ncbi:MAG: hypothetical protein BWX99_02955 [Deltaproteobacteria bacterium ADurb.Bin151]|nr:MAG: hypothetical protein BWX99_02955 [Deltaproteobacteria bacterium ADurb.Bin151]
MQKSLVGVKARRRNGGHQIFYFVRMLRRIHNTKTAAHAYSHEIDFGNVVFLADEIHNIVHITVDVIVNGQKTVFALGITPVHHVQVDPAIQKCFDNASVRLQIEHGFPVNQRIDHQQGNF